MKVKGCNSGPTRSGYTIWCPGCAERHFLPTVSATGPVWQFNGNREKPTFTPSLKITTGCKTSQHKPGDSCWCTFNAELIAKGEEPSGFECGVCHLVLTDGVIHYCPDSTHKLSGQQVPLPDLPD